MAHAARIGCYFCHCFGHTGGDHQIAYDSEATRRWEAGQRQWKLFSTESMDIDKNVIPWTVLAEEKGISLEGIPTDGVPQRRGIAILVALSLAKKGFALWHPIDAVGNEVPRGDIYTNTELATLKVKREPSVGGSVSASGSGGSGAVILHMSGIVVTEAPAQTVWKSKVESRLETLEKNITAMRVEGLYGPDHECTANPPRENRFHQE